MKVAVLSSSRADYGIYLPLLKAMQKDSFFDLHIIAFGTHLSSTHGHTIDTIIRDGFVIDHEVAHILSCDSEKAIAESMTIAFDKFVAIWEKEKNNYDLVFCLGDRYEMFAAVSAAIPFNLKFAHIHGGETTLGAIDNKFRHCLTLFSSLHFVATETYARRVAEIKGSSENIYVIGSLSLDNLDQIELLSKEELRETLEIDLSKPTLLVTYHPETVAVDENEKNVMELIGALKSFNDHQIIITMPNADTKSNTLRNAYKRFASTRKNIVLVENFGTVAYFSCMNLSKLIVGNSSSGIIEAASFKKYVVDIGNRQKGRVVSGNVIHSDANAASIRNACREALGKGQYPGNNIYYRKNAAPKIIEVLRTWK